MTTQTQMNVSVANGEAESVDALGMQLFQNVDWEVESGDFWSTFSVWSVFDTDESRGEVQRFVDWASDFQGE